MSGQPKSNPKSPRLIWLIVPGVLSWLLYAGFSWLSRDFGYETPGPERPLLEALGLLVAAFVCYLPAIWAAVRAEGHRDLTATILIFAAGFRATLLFTEPYQEIDIYRYVWDGQVTATGVSPFHYTPRDVRTADPDDVNLPTDLRRLAALRDSDPALKTVLERIHFEQFPTVYPATSQTVFALAAFSTPDGAEVRTHLVVMKLWVSLFDLLTLLGAILILRHLGKPVGWAVAYGWCPLVLKEFANSGHLDAIAVCCTTFAVYCALRAFFPKHTQASAGQLAAKTSRRWCAAAAVLLALGIGAKLYPVVLGPLLFCTALRRRGWWSALGAGLLAGGLSAALMFPMLAGGTISSDSAQTHSARSAAPVARWPRDETGRIVPREVPPPIPGGGDRAARDDPADSPAAVPHASPPLPPVAPRRRLPAESHTSPSSKRDTTAGLKAFLSHWKMNDFLFMVIEENLTPRAKTPPEYRPWFVVTSEAWRQRTDVGARNALTTTAETLTGSSLGLHRARMPFVIARGLTAAAFLVLALYWSWRASREGSPERFLEAVFLTLAWFWLLAPTVNPWYWIWALPFVPFARGRAWLAMSGLVLIYYARFWFQYQMADDAVWFTTYRGTLFFDYVVVWFEFGPWFVWLIGAAVCRRVFNVENRTRDRSATK